MIDIGYIGRVSPNYAYSPSVFATAISRLQRSSYYYLTGPSFLSIYYSSSSIILYSRIPSKLDIR